MTHNKPIFGSFDFISKRISRGIYECFQFVFPDVCIFCGRVLTPEKDCAALFFSREMHMCRKCLAKLPLCPPPDTVAACLSNAQASDPIPDFSVVVPFQYEQPIAAAIRMLKFHNADYAANTIACFMASAVSLQCLSFDAVIPIPLSAKRLRRRGYNQALRLAEPIANTLCIPCLSTFLERRFHTAQQSRFTDPIQRKANVSGAFRVQPDADVTGLSILLVDDVMTTGATFHEAATALYRDGAAFVMGVAAASGRFAKNEATIKRFAKT